MNKARGSVSILVIFIFAILSFLLLFLLSRLERGGLLLEAERDGLKSGYAAESMAHLAYRSTDEEVFRQVLLERDAIALNAPSWDGIAGEKAKISPIRTSGAYTRFSLSADCRYRGIYSRAIVTGELVHPLFAQQDGILSADEIETAGLLPAWKEAFRLWSYAPKDRLPSVVVDRPSEMHYNGGKWILTDGADGQIQTEAKQALDIRSELSVPDGYSTEGLVFLRSGSVLRGTLYVRGVVIAEADSVVEGKIVCDGLCIGYLPMDTVSNFHPRKAERYLANFPEFLECGNIRTKKEFR